MDYIGVKQFGPDRRLIGEFRIVGLFTSTVYTGSVRAIPYLRRKVDSVVARAGFDPESHSGKALVNVLETYPRDELFQVEVDALYRFSLAILQLDERPRVRVLPRRDRFNRFVSVLVFTPRERYDSEVRRRIGDYLAGVYNGRVSAFFPFFPEGPLVRVHFIIGFIGEGAPGPDRAALEAAVGAIVRTWNDTFLDSLMAAHDLSRARALFARYRDAFSEGYREAYSPATAVDDIRVVERLSDGLRLSADFHRRGIEEGAAIGLKVWSHGRPIPLSERVPVLENMEFRVVDELTFRIALTEPDPREVWLHDMVLERAGGGTVDFEARKQALQTCFIVVMTG